jgi:hypothetical protein
MSTERTERIERLQLYVREGRIIRNAWTGEDAQGRETACLLAALSPEAGEEERASACPAHVMPEWLARLTPMLDDKTPEAYWPEFVRCYAYAAARWHVLDDAAWRRVLARVMLASLDVARPHDRSGVVARVADLCRRVLDGNEPAVCEWTAAEEAARAAAWALAEEAARATRAEGAAWALVEAGEAAARAARAAARAAAGAGAWALPEAAGDAGAWAGEAAAWATEAAEVVTAWDTIARATLAAINTECDAQEVGE